MVRSVIWIFSVFLTLPLSSAEADARPVERSERALVAVVNLSLRARSNRAIYRYEEKRAAKKIRRDLASHYGRTVIFEGKAATRENFLRAVREVSADPAVRAIDVIVYLHGAPGAIAFVDTGYFPSARIRDDLLALDTEVRAETGGVSKFRALYSDACWGESHIADWLRAGFRTVSGAIDQDSNWSKDLGRWMKTWRERGSFEAAIRRANRVWTSGFTDWVIGGNSRKLIEGERAITIDTPVDF
jgi:hypothetical protein